MSSKTNKPGPIFSILMHETLNDISTIMSIAQFSLISREMPPEVREDMKRIVESGRQMADKLKLIAEVLQEEED
jgi:hypothetical protein